MKGISVIRLLDVIPASSISNAVGVSPRSIIIRGADFASVESVLINGVSSPEFVVLSTSEIVAQVPDDQDDAIITDIAVLSAAFTMTARSLVELTVGNHVRSVQGIQRMMQVFLRQLLRTPGTNIFHRRSGGGLLKRLGTIADDSVAADAAVAVSSAKQYIVNIQSGDRTIPPSERLLAAEISGLRTEKTAVYLTVVLTNHAGTRAAASVVA